MIDKDIIRLTIKQLDILSQQGCHWIYRYKDSGHCYRSIPTHPFSSNALDRRQRRMLNVVICGSTLNFLYSGSWSSSYFWNKYCHNTPHIFWNKYFHNTISIEVTINAEVTLGPLFLPATYWKAIRTLVPIGYGTWPTTSSTTSCEESYLHFNPYSFPVRIPQCRHTSGSLTRHFLRSSTKDTEHLSPQFL